MTRTCFILPVSPCYKAEDVRQAKYAWWKQNVRSIYPIMFCQGDIHTLKYMEPMNPLKWYFPPIYSVCVCVQNV